MYLHVAWLSGDTAYGPRDGSTPRSSQFIVLPGLKALIPECRLNRSIRGDPPHLPGTIRTAVDMFSGRSQHMSTQHTWQHYSTVVCVDISHHICTNTVLHVVLERTQCNALN
eukprot:jgi/Chrzof1/11499/UNPLg00431.t1